MNTRSPSCSLKRRDVGDEVGIGDRWQLAGALDALLGVGVGAMAQQQQCREGWAPAR